MPNRSIRDEMQSDRPKVGPADPATQRRFLANYEASAKREARERIAKQRTVRVPETPNATRDLSAMGAANKLSGRGRQIDKQLKEAGA